MTKLVKYLVIGGSTTAVVGGGAAGAAVAISHKSSNNNSPKQMTEFEKQQAFDAKFDSSARKGEIEIKKAFMMDDYLFDSAARKGEIEIKKAFMMDDYLFDSSARKGEIEIKKSLEQAEAETLKETYTSYQSQLVADQSAYPQIAEALSKVVYDPLKSPEENRLAVEKVLEQEVAKVEAENKDEFTEFTNRVIASIKKVSKNPSPTLLEMVRNFQFNPRETFEFNQNELNRIVSQIKSLVLDTEHGEDKANEMADRLNKNVYLHTHQAEFNKIFQAVLTGTLTAEYVYSTYPDQHELTEAYDELDKIPYIHDNPMLLDKTFKAIEDGSTTLQAVETDYGITKL